MTDRSVAALDRGLFVSKGAARPAPDYVLHLKTEEPARLDLTAAPPPAPTSGGGGLGGLIRRSVAPRQLPEQQVAYERSREHAATVELEAETLRRTIAEQVDNGLMYESLLRGLPMPGVQLARRQGTEMPAEPSTFEEAARERISRPTRPDGTGAERRKAARRRKLTARLKMRDFTRFKRYADETGRTYQDVLAAATVSYLDWVSTKEGDPLQDEPEDFDVILDGDDAGDDSDSG